jgi:hypothetical protein
MEDDVGLETYDSVESLPASDVADDELQACRAEERLRVARHRLGGGIEHKYVEAIVRQRADEMQSDETRATGDKGAL